MATRFPRLGLTVAYAGTEYHGIQYHKDAKTIAGELFRACRAIGLRPRADAEADDSIGAWDMQLTSRTDRGVHALRNLVTIAANSVHPFEVAMSRQVIGVREALNECLPPEIRVLGAVKLSRGFDVRGEAESRTYEYYVPLAVLHEDVMGALNRQKGLVLRGEGYELDGEDERVLDRFEGALERYLGVHSFHNFTSARERHREVEYLGEGGRVEDFREERRESGGDPYDDWLDVVNEGCLEDVGGWRFGNTMTRAMYGVEVVERCGQVGNSLPFVKVCLTGSSFLYHQIRLMMGAAIGVARGVLDVAVIDAALNLARFPRLPLAPPGTLVLSSPNFDPVSGLTYVDKSWGPAVLSSPQRRGLLLQGGRGSWNAPMVSLCGEEGETIVKNFEQDLLNNHIIKSIQDMDNLEWHQNLAAAIRQRTEAAHQAVESQRGRRIFSPTLGGPASAASTPEVVGSVSDEESEILREMAHDPAVTSLASLQSVYRTLETFPGMVAVADQHLAQSVQDQVLSHWSVWRAAQLKKQQTTAKKEWASRVANAIRAFGAAPVHQLLEQREQITPANFFQGEHGHFEQEYFLEEEEEEVYFLEGDEYSSPKKPEHFLKGKYFLEGGDNSSTKTSDNFSPKTSDNFSPKKPEHCSSARKSVFETFPHIIQTPGDRWLADSVTERRHASFTISSSPQKTQNSSSIFTSIISSTESSEDALLLQTASSALHRPHRDLLRRAGLPPADMADGRPYPSLRLVKQTLPKRIETLLRTHAKATQPGQAAAISLAIAYRVSEGHWPLLATSKHYLSLVQTTSIDTLTTEGRILSLLNATETGVALRLSSPSSQKSKKPRKQSSKIRPTLKAKP